MAELDGATSTCAQKRTAVHVLTEQCGVGTDRADTLALFDQELGKRLVCWVEAKLCEPLTACMRLVAFIFLYRRVM